MKIAVCVKWVPVVSRMRFDLETKRIVREGVPNEVNAYDQLAVQRAVELKASHGADIAVFTMGPPSAKQGLVTCLAMGADRAFHIVDPALAGSDTLATARALAFALKREAFDIILFGYHSVDAETGQVGPEVAELMGLPQVTGVHKLDVVAGGRLRLERVLDDGTETVECAMPVLVSVTEGIAPEVFPPREAMQAAQQRPIPEITAKELSADLSVFGQAGSPTWVTEIRLAESKRAQQLVDEAVPAAEAARTVAEFIRARGHLDASKRGSRREGEPVRPAVRPLVGQPVWVVAEVGPDGVRTVTYELLGAAQAIADAVHGHVVGVLMGGPDVGRSAADLAHHGADAVAMASDAALSAYTTQAYADVLAAGMQAAKPYAVLLPSTVNGRDLAARVAARLRLGLTGDCVGLEVDGQGRLVQLKPAFGGNVVAPILSKTVPNMATVRPGLLEQPRPDRTRIAPVVRLAVPAAGRPAVSVVARRHDAADATGIEDAWAVIAVGKGVGGPDRIAGLEPLRRLLDAQLICTRDVVEAGWMPRQRQVGLTGRSIAPDLYIGVGVRGDFNHIVGIQRAGTVVAINNNRRAAIFRQVDMGVVADWNVFVPALVDALQAARL